MCGCNSSCANCAASSADGATYDPAQMAGFVNKYLYDGKAGADELQDAYVKVMMWIEGKSLPFTEETISGNIDQIKADISNPNFTKDPTAANKKERDGMRMALVFLALAGVAYFLFKSE